MELVLDANVLFRTLISQGRILDIIFDPKLTLFAPLMLKEEFLNNKKEILSKSRLPESTFNELTSLLFNRVNFVPLNEYSSFIFKAKSLLGTHTKDEDFVALCLLKHTKLWTYEPLLFKIGVGISTKEIAEELSKDASTPT